MLPRYRSAPLVRVNLGSFVYPLFEQSLVKERED
jgi:hypothetical protein